MSSNVTWEPVESGWCDVEEDDDDGSSIAWDGVCVSIMMDGDLSWRKLPPDLRLCRAKQVAEAPPATWSQEPPDAEGPWQMDGRQRGNGLGDQRRLPAAWEPEGAVMDMKPLGDFINVVVWVCVVVLLLVGIAIGRWVL